MLNAALIGMGRWGQTLVNSVQGRNGAGIRFVAGATRTPEKARGWAVCDNPCRVFVSFLGAPQACRLALCRLARVQRLEWVRPAAVGRVARGSRSEQDPRLCSGPRVL